MTGNAPRPHRLVCAVLGPNNGVVGLSPLSFAEAIAQARVRSSRAAHHMDRLAALLATRPGDFPTQHVGLTSGGYALALLRLSLPGAVRDGDA